MGSGRELAPAERPHLAAKFSKTQIDRLGDRIREASLTETDLRLLDEYRRSFGEAYETVVGTIRDQLQLEPTGRPAKSTSSIIEKLHRESIRLSQVQDIAGCRVIVADVAEQESVVASLRAAFPGTTVIDRRLNPSYGYRAVHVIPKVSEKLVEIQVRTALQHLWAELSEKLSDVIDPAIKYGQGSKEHLDMLARFSYLVTQIERAEKEQSKPETGIVGFFVTKFDRLILSLRRQVTEILSETISRLESRKRKR
jgi:ppGpp synthetase/RelA/SpoT-type nucleotidyltranferase